MYRPAPGPHLIRPRPSRSSETFFQPVRVLTWRVMLTRAIASTSGELDAIMDAKRVEVKLRLTKQKNFGGRACKPDSVRHASVKRPACAAIIPLGHASRRDSSSLPEGGPHDGLRHRRGSMLTLASRSSSRAGSPLLFGLAPRGVFHAPGIATGTVGSYPTFSPLPNEPALPGR